jgi:hypothetical protein
MVETRDSLRAGDETKAGEERTDGDWLGLGAGVT